jgi:hypothetical protein
LRPFRPCLRWLRLPRRESSLQQMNQIYGPSADVARNYDTHVSRWEDLNHISSQDLGVFMIKGA